MRKVTLIMSFPPYRKYIFCNKLFKAYYSDFMGLYTLFEVYSTYLEMCSTLETFGKGHLF
jgi:hypothetical protein